MPLNKETELVLLFYIVICGHVYFLKMIFKRQMSITYFISSSNNIFRIRNSAAVKSDLEYYYLDINPLPASYRLNRILIVI